MEQWFLHRDCCMCATWVRQPPLSSHNCIIPKIISYSQLQTSSTNLFSEGKEYRCILSIYINTFMNCNMLACRVITSLEFLLAQTSVNMDRTKWLWPSFWHIGQDVSKLPSTILAIAGNVGSIGATKAANLTYTCCIWLRSIECIFQLTKGLMVGRCMKWKENNKMHVCKTQEKDCNHYEWNRVVE